MAISEVIKYEGDNETFVWKYPLEDFNATTQLIVHESQEAIFFMNGQALDLFGAGRYTLETQNMIMHIKNKKLHLLCKKTQREAAMLRPAFMVRMIALKCGR